MGVRRAAVQHAICVFFLIFGLLLLVYSGVFRSIDELALYDAVEQTSIYRQPLTSSQMPQLHWAFYGPSKNLGGVGNFEPGQILLAIPLVIAALGWPSGSMQLTLLFNPLVTAATAAVLYSYLALLGYRVSTRVAAILLYVFATQALYYSTTFFREPLVGLSLLVAALAMQQIMEKGRTARGGSNAPASDARLGRLWLLGMALIVGGALGWGTITKSSTWALVPVFVVVFVAGMAKAGFAYRRTGGIAAIALAGLVVAQGVALTYAGMAGQGLTGDRPLPSGQLARASDSYGLLFDGLFGLLASAGHGVLIYSPVFLLCFPGAVLLWQRTRLLTVLIVGSSAALIALYSSYERWDAGFVWGTRFLVPLMPLWLILIAPAVDFAMAHPRRARSVLIAALALLSAVIQIASVWINVYPILAKFDTGRLTDYANAPALRVVEAWLRGFPFSDTILWLPNPEALGSRLDLPTLAVVFVICGASLGVWILSPWLKIQAWKRAAASASILLLLFGFATPKVINHYGNLLLRYETVEADQLRSAAEFVRRNATPHDTVFGVSYSFQFNLLQSFGPRRTRFYWFSTENSPLESGTVGRLEEAASKYRRVWIVLDRIPQVGPESGIEYWLIDRGYKFEEKWFASYKVAGYDLPGRPLLGSEPQVIQLGDIAYLDNVRFDSGPARPGDGVRLEATWHILAEPTVKLMPRLQLVDASGAVHHFTLDELKAGLYPSAKWQKGVVVADRRSLRLPASLAPGEYALQVAVVEAEGAKIWAGPSRRLGQIIVKSNSEK